MFPQSKIFIRLFKTKPEFSIKQLEKVNQHVYVICKSCTFLIKKKKSDTLPKKVFLKGSRESKCVQLSLTSS